MKLSEVCTEANLAWEKEFVKVYHYTDESNVSKSVFKYQIPFDEDKESVFLMKYGVPMEKRMQFYQNLVRCIQKQVSVSKRLADSGIASVLSFSNMEQDRNEAGVTHIYLETEQVWPILDHVIKEQCPYLTLLDITSRLALILRDINKSAAAVVHRGLDLNEVYINARNRILLGGFFYAEAKDTGATPEYLPCLPPHIPRDLLHGGTGSHKTDIQTLSYMAWNLFSGIPFDAQWATTRMPVPEFAEDGLTDALLCGIACEDDICNIFRRKLNEHRKHILKMGGESKLVPIRKPSLKEIKVYWVAADSEESDSISN